MRYMLYFKKDEVKTFIDCKLEFLCICIVYIGFLVTGCGQDNLGKDNQHTDGVEMNQLPVFIENPRVELGKNRINLPDISYKIEIELRGTNDWEEGSDAWLVQTGIAGLKFESPLQLPERIEIFCKTIKSLFPQSRFAFRAILKSGWSGTGCVVMCYIVKLNISVLSEYIRTNGLLYFDDSCGDVFPEKIPDIEGPKERKFLDWNVLELQHRFLLEDAMGSNSMIFAYREAENSTILFVFGGMAPLQHVENFLQKVTKIDGGSKNR